MEEELLPKIVEIYRLNIRSSELFHYTTRTLVLLIKTDQGNFVVKSIYVDRKRMEFILAVEKHLREKGISIPRTIPMANGELIFLCNGVPFAMQEYVEGKPVLLTSAKTYQERGRLLGNIHSRSLGFAADDGEDYRGTKKWGDAYQEELGTLDNWRKMYQKTKRKELQLIHHSLDFFLEAGDQLYRQLAENSLFSLMNKDPLSKQYICHGDFHTGNVLWNQAEHRFSIIDWEFTRYDFPSVDLGRLLFIIMRNEERWNSASFAALLSGYLQENPLNQEQLELLYLDLAFPHSMERFLRKKLYKEMSTTQIKQFLQREREKTSYLLNAMKG